MFAYRPSPPTGRLPFAQSPYAQPYGQYGQQPYGQPVGQMGPWRHHRHHHTPAQRAAWQAQQMAAQQQAAATPDPSVIPPDPSADPTAGLPPPADGSDISGFAGFGSLGSFGGGGGHGGGGGTMHSSPMPAAPVFASAPARSAAPIGFSLPGVNAPQFASATGPQLSGGYTAASARAAGERAAARLNYDNYDTTLADLSWDQGYDSGYQDPTLIGEMAAPVAFDIYARDAYGHHRRW